MVVRQILGRVSLQISAGRRLALSNGDEEEAVPVERKPGTVVPATLGHRLEDLLDTCDAIVLEPTAHHRGGCL